ncbi:hypothetical protein BJX63DRAFT_399144 [Aspergillus granulosus]|uniref:Uncharacterized protein n=1 Tax=Aspergillus granulosus TaxID=176169 RepID=A0ABR4H9T7_9EURO
MMGAVLLTIGDYSGCPSNQDSGAAASTQVTGAESYYAHTSHAAVCAMDHGVAFSKGIGAIVIGMLAYCQYMLWRLRPCSPITY